MLPLNGIRVLDLTTLLPGPLATLILREAGATVTKIERPGQGDEMRGYEPKLGRSSVNFALLNRGKRSLELDLKTSAGRDRMLALAEQADVLVEQFRPGVMERLGLDFGSLVELNPRIVYCSITGYGQSGPRARRAAHDLNYLGDSGMLELVHDSTGTPPLPPALIADIAGGAYPAVMNILLALRSREQTGEGAHLDVSMSDNVLPFLYWAIGNGTAASAWPRPSGEQLTGGSPRYQLYRTADALHVAAAPLEDRFWERFCELIALPEALRQPEADQKQAIAAVAGRIARHPAAHWQALFADEDVCCTIAQSVEEALADEQFISRGVFERTVGEEDGDERSVPAMPLPLAPGLRDVQPHLAYPALGSG
jgi:crotonobetainyl-CoA:carnitine CoA-transferase CaiB-like acyl-CoA transferase